MEKYRTQVEKITMNIRVSFTNRRQMDLENPVVQKLG
jgi:hypothetical protein